MSDKISKKKREAVADRASECCEFCQSQAIFSPDPFSVEHIIPRSKGGGNDLDNLAFSCQGCNNRKYNFTEAIDPVTNTVVPLFNPRMDNWDQNFQWNNEKTLIIGITPSGRATIQRLELNRRGLTNLRKVLTAAGKHPPGIG